jgi:hypothetical protein
MFLKTQTDINADITFGTVLKYYIFNYLFLLKEITMLECMQIDYNLAKVKINW